MSKKIIRLSSNQVLKQVFTNSQIANKTVEQPILTRSQSSLRGLEKPCGLFNPFEEDIENNNDQLFMDLLLENMEESNIKTHDVIENKDIFSENLNFESSIDQKAPTKKVSKFAKKVQDLNMKINIPNQQTLQSFGSADQLEKQSSIVPDIKSTVQEITPDTEKMYFQFIQSIPSAQLGIGQDTQPVVNFDFLDQFGTEENFEKLILGCTSPQVSQIANDPLLNSESNFKNSLIQSLPLDHEYSLSPKKRKISDNVFEDSLTNDSFSSSTTFTDSFSVSLPKKTKNPRTRGIYRADDVTNENELQNYLERRKKNNQSSKVSRANKKNFYSEMSLKCDELVKSNDRLNNKIIELEKLNKIIRDMLVENFKQTKP